MKLVQSAWKENRYHVAIHMDKTLYEALTVEEDYHIEKIMDILREYLYRLHQKYKVIE